MKKLRISAFSVAFILYCACLLPAWAQWIQNSGVGPFDYENTANWNGSVINNQFLTNVTSGMNITFGANFSLSSLMLLGWSNNASVTFSSSSSTPQTIQFPSNGGIAVSNSLGGIITLGSTNNPLILDLAGSTNCTFGGVPGTSGSANTSMNINAQIIDSSGKTNGIKVAGDRVYTYLLNTNNSFVGPVNFYALRGGGFANIKPIGGGPSALGAPTDSTNGVISATDNSSAGALRYMGSGDTSDRPFVWNVTFSNQIANAYQFANAGTGLLKLSGQMSFPTNGTNGSQFIISATNAPIELDGYIHGTGNVNGTFTMICFAGGPANTSTNRITLTGLTNDFRDFIISNVVLSYNGTAPAGVPCSIGAGTNVVVGGGSASPAGWQGNAGQGSSLQYSGATNATFTRNIILNGQSYGWALDNAGASNTLTWNNTISWNSNPSITGFNPRYLYINPTSTSTNVVYSYIPDANFNAGGTPIGITLGLGNPYGTTVANGGYVQLLNPTNTFAGGVQIAYARTLQALTLANIGQPSSIGTGAGGYFVTENGVAVPMNGINLGSFDSSRGGFFSYIGTNNTSCNQKITVFGPTFSTAVMEVCGLRNDSPNNSSLHMSDTSSWFLQPQGASGGTNAYQADLGGSAITTNTLDSVIGDMPSNGNVPVPNTGNLLVNGSAWRLTAAQTYSGTTMVANATLLMDGSIASGLGLTVGAGGVLAGTGTVNENVNVLTNGTIAAGDGALGTLTINGNLTNSGSIFMKLNAAGATNDQLVLGANTLAYGGGILVVSNTAGTLAAGDSFTLFSAGSYTGAFGSVSPATPGPGLAWNLAGLTNGVLSVVTGVTPSAPKLTTITISGSNVILSGTNGTVSGPYHVLSSTNLTLPLNQWLRLTNSTFDSQGNFIITNPVSGPVEFYLIEEP